MWPLVLSAGATASTILGETLTGLGAGDGGAAALVVDVTGRGGFGFACITGFGGFGAWALGACAFGGERACLCLAARFFAFRFFANRDRSCRYCRPITRDVHAETGSPRRIAVVVSTEV